MLASLAINQRSRPRDAFESLSGLLDDIQPRLNDEGAMRKVENVAKLVQRGYLDKGLAISSSVDVDSLIAKVRKSL